MRLTPQQLEIWKSRTEKTDDWTDAQWAELERTVAGDAPPSRFAGVRGLFRMVNPEYTQWHRARLLGESERVDTPPWLRRQVIERDGLVCGICGGDVDRDDVHIDHIYPASKGGLTVASNLRVTHSQCNVRKGDKVSDA